MPDPPQPFVAMLPRAIETNADRIECLERAREFILRTAGSNSRLAIRDDCVALVDADGRGFSKVYPDGMRVRLNIRGSGIADVNVFVPDRELAATHVRIDDTLMDDVMLSVQCLGPSRQ